MSNFIVPLGSLPTISSVTDIAGKQNLQNIGGQGVPFADFLQNAFQNMASTGEASKAGMYNLAMGATDDLHNTVLDGIKYSTAVSYASGLTSTAISAYNELMRMQV